MEEAIRQILDSPDKFKPGRLVVCMSCKKSVEIPPELLAARAALQMSGDVKTIRLMVVIFMVILLASILAVIIRAVS